jgi:hypothetical protein
MVWTVKQWRLIGRARMRTAVLTDERCSVCQRLELTAECRASFFLKLHYELNIALKEGNFCLR